MPVCHALVVTTIVLFSFALPVRAATPGFIEDFVSPPVTWFGADILHILTGGVGGAGDPYMRVSRDFPSNLGAASDQLDYTGDLIADGVTGFSFYLSDLAQDDPLEIHVGVGSALTNFWQYKIGFAPPTNAWQQYSVDFSDPSAWVQIKGSGTFASALMNSNRLLFRHDLAPYIFNPDLLAGDFGIDRIEVIPEPVTLLLLALGGWAGLRRRLA